jgi:hypothetical protein
MPASPPSGWAAAGVPSTHRGAPSGFPGPHRRLGMSPPDPRRPYRPSRSRAASAVLAAGLVAGVLAAQAGLPWAGLAGLTVAVLVGWRLRFRPSTQARAWQRGAHGEHQTARLLDRLGRDGYVVFHDLALPDSPANLDHLVIGPSGVFVVDSKQWTGSIHQSADGLIWHNHYRLDCTLATLRWQAETLGRLLGVPAAPLICIHGAHVQGGGLHAQGVAIVPASLLRPALGDDQLLSEVDIQRYAATARMRLCPAA